MPESDFLARTRASYDTLAGDLTDLWRDDLAAKAWDRAALAAFAELVGRGGRVLDVGCGAGRITRHLADLGLDVSGVDLSPGMVAEARRGHPDLVFTVGDMTELQIEDGSLAGLLAFYSIIHVPPASLPDVFAGFARALAPGGHLLVVFQVGSDVWHLSEALGHTFDLDFHRRTCAEVATWCEEAGLVVNAKLEREGVAGLERTPQGYVLARKPAAFSE